MSVAPCASPLIPYTPTAPPTYITQHRSNAKGQNGYIKLYQLHGFYCRITISDLAPLLLSESDRRVE